MSHPRTRHAPAPCSAPALHGRSHRRPLCCATRGRMLSLTHATAIRGFLFVLPVKTTVLATVEPALQICAPPPSSLAARPRRSAWRRRRRGSGRSRSRRTRLLPSPRRPSPRRRASSRPPSPRGAPPAQAPGLATRRRTSARPPARPSSPRRCVPRPCPSAPHRPHLPTGPTGSEGGAAPQRRRGLQFDDPRQFSLSRARVARGGLKRSRASLTRVHSN